MTTFDTNRLIARRANAIDASGIRRVFELGAKLKDPINLSIGQPDFPVPEPITAAAINAIEAGKNGYTVTQGVAPLIERINEHLHADLGWQLPSPSAMSLVTSGTSGALLLTMMAILDEGDELVIPEPYFVMYPHLATMCGARAVMCDCGPDLRMTAERVEPLLTDRTKAVLINSPSNPAGVVLTAQECDDLYDLCTSRNVLLISDEIYDEFTYADARTDRFADGSRDACPSPCRGPGREDNTLLIRGFGKTYGITGWRMGYAAGPAALLQHIAKLQQYTFVCAPSPAQWGSLAAFDVDMEPHITDYQQRRDLVMEILGPHTNVPTPGGAFYAFPAVPEHLGITATQFCERALERNVLVIPGSVFSQRDDHFRLSYATPKATLERGLREIADLMTT